MRLPHSGSVHQDDDEVIFTIWRGLGAVRLSLLTSGTQEEPFTRTARQSLSFHCSYICCTTDGLYGYKREKVDPLYRIFPWVSSAIRGMASASPAGQKFITASFQARQMTCEYLLAAVEDGEALFAKSDREPGERQSIGNAKC